jgi:hypothetical protein
MDSYSVYGGDVCDLISAFLGSGRSAPDVREPPIGSGKESCGDEKKHQLRDELSGLEHEEQKNKAGQYPCEGWHVVPVYFAEGLFEMVEVHAFGSLQI